MNAQNKNLKIDFTFIKMTKPAWHLKNMQSLSQPFMALIETWNDHTIISIKLNFSDHQFKITTRILAILFKYLIVVRVRVGTATIVTHDWLVFKKYCSQTIPPSEQRYPVPEMFLASFANKQPRNYDTECSNHHPSQSGLGTGIEP